MSDATAIDKNNLDVWTPREEALLDVAMMNAEEAREYEGYSGRFMYGTMVNGVVVDHGSADEVIDEMAERGWGSPCRDSMGMDVILYYKNRSR